MSQGEAPAVDHGGRPNKFTDDRVQRVLAAIRAGNTLRAAAIYAGISLHWTAADPRVGCPAQRRTGAHADLRELLESHRVQFRALREFVLNASDYTSHADVAVAFRRY